MKSWIEKRNAPGVGIVKPVSRDMAGMRVGETMFVPTAAEVDAFVRRIPAGTALSLSALRKAMAKEQGVDSTCPVTLGYHLRTIAEAAGEDLQHGVSEADIVPFWRVLDERAPTTGRLALGPTFVVERRRREGLDP